MEHGAGWRTVWQDLYEPDSEMWVTAAAVAVVPGKPTTVVVTEEWAGPGADGLKADNTTTCRLDDGVKVKDEWIMLKYAFDTPRVAVSDPDGSPIVVVNSGRGVFRWGTRAIGRHPLGGVDWPAEDVVVGRQGGRPVVAAMWSCQYADKPLHTYDVETGEPIGPPCWGLSIDRYPCSGRLGRVAGQAVVAATDGASLWVCPTVPDATDDIVLPGGRRSYSSRLLAIDDAAGPSLALVGYEADVGCHDARTGATFCPPLTGWDGELTGARLGRWRGLPVAALLSATGVWLFDLTGRRPVDPVPTPGAVHDLAFAPDGRLALSTAAGVLVVEPRDGGS